MVLVVGVEAGRLGQRTEFGGGGGRRGNKPVRALVGFHADKCSLSISEQVIDQSHKRQKH